MSRKGILIGMRIIPFKSKTVKSAAPAPAAKKNPLHTITGIMDALRGLAKSKGYWGRLYEQLTDLRDYDPCGWRRCKADLEYEEFQDLLDLIYYFEEGDHTKIYYQKKRRDGYRLYTVKVERSLECEVQVLAKDEDEASELAIKESIDNNDAVSIKTTVTGVADISKCMSCANSHSCGKKERSD